MPTFQVTDPNGKTFKVNAPDGATQDQAVDYVKANHDNLLAQQQPTKPPPVVDAAPAAPGLLQRGVNAVRGAIDGMPAARTAAKAQIADEKKRLGDGVVGSVKAIGERAKSNTQMQDAWSDVVKDFTTKPKAPTARVVKTGFDLAGLAVSPVAAGVTTLVGPEVQAATGLGKETAGNLASGAVGMGEVKSLASLARGAARVAAKVPERIASGTAGKIFAPATVDAAARQQAPIQRAVLGETHAMAVRAASQLEKHQRVIGNAPIADQREVINYIESRSKGAKLANPKYQSAADDIRTISQRFKGAIQTTMTKGGHGPSFIDDYYPRMWKEPPASVKDALRPTGKQGSGRALKARSVPTYQDGLNAGLTPVHENPIDGMTAYVDSMSKFLGVHQLQEQMKTAGLAKWVPEKDIPPGWVKLDGIARIEATPVTKTNPMNEKVLQGVVGPRVLAAPEGAARLYNNHIGTGFAGNELTKGPYKAVRAAANGLTQTVLGVSGFHPMLVGLDGMASEIGKGAKQISRGDVLEGAKSILKSPAAPFSLARAGGKMGKELRGEALPDALGQKINDLHTRAGGRITMEQIYQSSEGADFFRSLRRGTLARDVGDALAKTMKGSALDRAKGTASLTLKVLDSLNAPIFRMYVPAMKKGAFRSALADYLKSNPAASQAEQEAFARATLDSLDDRMGEVVKDNNFWNAYAYQTAQVAMLSPSWNIGTVRLFGKGIRDLPASASGLVKGKGIEGTTAALGGIVAASMLGNGLMNYAHTGQMPQGEDWWAFRTGGETPQGKPERAAVPSYMKDAEELGFDFPNNVLPTIAGKANPGLSTAIELIGNKDWKGDPIFRPAHARPVEGDDGAVGQLGAYARTKLPIASRENPNPKTGMSGLEALAGLRPAGQRVSDPDRKIANAEKYDSIAWKRKVMKDRKAANRKAG